jgi:hypothetical protein
MPVALFALEWYEITMGVVVALAVAAILWTPYLYREIRKGKADVAPGAPVGASDVNVGTRFDPAPGEPDGQGDPYSARAQRSAPHIKS